MKNGSPYKAASKPSCASCLIAAALRGINQEFILNGDWNIDNSGWYQGAGASFMYRRQSKTRGETITAAGPITQPVDIFVSTARVTPLNNVGELDSAEGRAGSLR